MTDFDTSWRTQDEISEIKKSAISFDGDCGR